MDAREANAATGDRLGPAPSLKVKSATCVPVRVPLKIALGTSATAVREAPLLLVDLATEEGVVGRSYVFCYTPAGSDAVAAVLQEAVAAVAGEAFAPRTVMAKLSRRYELFGVVGAVRMALSAIDMAMWDAVAVAAGVPLYSLLGAAQRSIQAYNSNGLGVMPLPALADQAQQFLAGGFRAMKLRLGYETLASDVAAIRAVRKVIPDDAKLMVDYNQALTLGEALTRCRAISKEGVFWIEEPIRQDDIAGYARLARSIEAPIQIGENFDGAKAMEAALEAGDCEFVMPDATRIGGVSGWVDAAGIASARGVPMSSHVYPEVSAHLLAATRTAHFCEYVDWASPILAEPSIVADGNVTPSAKPGSGVAWNDDAVRKYRTEK